MPNACFDKQPRPSRRAVPGIDHRLAPPIKLGRGMRTRRLQVPTRELKL